MCALVSLAVIDELAEIVGREAVLSARSDLVVFECDGFVIEKNSPDLVVFPETTEHVSAIVKLCNRHQLSFLPRGGRHKPGRRLPAGGWRRNDRPDPECEKSWRSISVIAMPWFSRAWSISGSPMP